MSYEDHLDALELFFGPCTPAFDVPDDVVDDAEEVLVALKRRGYAKAFASLRSRRLRPPYNEDPHLSFCLRVADATRLALERRGHDLGHGKCLPRSLAIATGLWGAGIPATMKVGVTKIASDSTSEFHAWTELQGQPVAPYCEIRGVYELVDEVTRGVDSEVRQ
ncbi:lasso peptide biosynthesis B2 protein [Pseudonocardia sp. DSM 110487]|uniref:lasso peptide biosynthesis B2 protein n=1 Tax=Pseudonocardia sp. DSM 110487 TaxID=2865833 RepID=UPI001C69D523|nr:lasso peptide biosynthesis B2 protein [Pseudonocardia sp. DSM 110487]